METRSGKGNKTPPKRNLGKVPDISTIKLADGNEYKLRPFTLNMMVEVEDKFDASFTKLFEQGKAKYVRYLLYLRLKDDYPNLTEKKLGELVTAEVLAEVYKQIIG